MEIPKKGWFIRKAADKPAHLSEVFFNGERMERIVKCKVGVDAESPLIKLELEFIGVDIAVEIVQNLEAQKGVPVEMKDLSGREPLTGSEASDMLDAAFQAEQLQKVAS